MNRSLDKLMSKSALSADDIAQLVLTAIDKQQFYVVPHKEARRLWVLKRLLPRSLYVKLLRKGNKPGSSKGKK